MERRKRCSAISLSKCFSERGPNGLLDVAFHPNFTQNRKYYLFYQVFEDGKVTSLIVEKEFGADFKGTPANQRGNY
jgi:glucose/arabinose dehydrogenase